MWGVGSLFQSVTVLVGCLLSTPVHGRGRNNAIKPDMELCIITLQARFGLFVDGLFKATFDFENAIYEICDMFFHFLIIKFVQAIPY